MKAHGGDTDDSNTSQDLYGQDSGKTVKGMDSKDGKNKELLNKQLQLLAEKSLNADDINSQSHQWNPVEDFPEWMGLYPASEYSPCLLIPFALP